MERKPILCLDFDGVLHAYTSGWQGIDVIPDGPVPGAMGFLRDAVEKFEVHVLSSRSREEEGRAAMVAWVREHLAAEFGEVEGARIGAELVWPRVKPPAFVSLDDRAIRFEGVWPNVEDLLAFEPWTKRGV